MWLNLNGFGYDIANDCNATERVYFQSGTWLCIHIVRLSLPQKIGNLVQRAAHAQQLVLAKDDQAFIIGIVGGADELDDFGVYRYALAAIVGHHNEGDHGLSFGENVSAVLNIGAPPRSNTSVRRAEAASRQLGANHQMFSQYVS